MADVVEMVRARAATAVVEPVWRMSRLGRVLVPAGGDLAEVPGPRWVLVLSGAVSLETAAGREALAGGDAALVDGRTAHRLVAAEASEVLVGDLRSVVTAVELPSPLVARGFGDRHAGVAALLAGCPLEGECRPSYFAVGYASLIGAAMTACWQEDTGHDADPAASDAVVDAVMAAVNDRPGEAWTVDRMARLVHLSRSALGERFRRTLGRGPMEVLREVRMREARRLLGDPSRPVEYVAYAVGYGSTAAFSRAFATHHGAAPRAWRDASSPRHGE